MSCDNRGKMLRRILERQNERHRAVQDELNEGSSTPRRGAYTEIARTRLLEKQAEIKPVPVYSVSPPPQKVHPILPNKIRPRSNSHATADRFIPSRRTQNFDFAKYCLMKRETQDEKNAPTKTYLDVISQINSLESTWRKRLMVRAIQGLDILSGASNQRVLNISGNSGLKEMIGGRRECTRRDSVVDDYEETVWKVRPRSRPLLGEHRQKIKMPHRSRLYRGAIDWGAKNCIVAPVDINLHFFTLDGPNRSHLSISVESTLPGSRQIKCLKWNHIGDKIAMYSRSLTICVFDVTASKVLWSEDCCCEHCDITCINWSLDDEEIVVGCTTGKVSLFHTRESKGDRMLLHIESHDGPVLYLAVSHNNRYLATSGLDKRVRIYLYPAMILYLEIGYYDATQAFAWHPWDMGTLCIGGGDGDGSLSLWDMHRQESIGYKRVAFLGHVKNMNWNKISGELVVEWYYWEGDKRFVTIPVLASWERIVDVAQWSTRYGDHASNIFWNPSHTKMGVQLSNTVLIWDFFGYEKSAWSPDAKEKKKTAFFQNITSKFNPFCIR